MRTATLNIAEADAERFWAKVDKTDTCWLWTASRRKGMYGTFRLNGENRFAHRVSYTLHFGSIPKGLLIDHLCHIKHCVRPDHLRAVTNKQNMENRKGANSNSSSGIRGVFFHKNSNVWQAHIRHNYERIVIGHFSTKEEAHKAVVEARARVFTPLGPTWLQETSKVSATFA